MIWRIGLTAIAAAAPLARRLRRLPWGLAMLVANYAAQIRRSDR